MTISTTRLLQRLGTFDQLGVTLMRLGAGETLQAIERLDASLDEDEGVEGEGSTISGGEAVVAEGDGAADA